MSEPEEKKDVTAPADDVSGVLDITTPISAVPPKVVKQEDAQVEVSGSPAFQCLEDLFQAGKLTGARVAFLRSKYTELHETLKSSRVHEAKLLRQAKAYTVELERQKVELDKADNFPDSSTTEVSKLREQLLKHYNELAEAEEREYQLEYKIECALEEKKLLDRELSRLPKSGDIEKKVKELQAGNDELRKETMQRQLEVKNVKEELEESQRLVALEKKELEKLTEELDNLKAELVHISSVPNQLAKEADKCARQKHELEAQSKQLDGQYQNFLETVLQLENQRQKLENEKYDMDADLDKQRAMMIDKEKMIVLLNKDYEYAKENETLLMQDRNVVDIKLRGAQFEKKNLHDIRSRKTREKDRDMKNLKKQELQLKVAEESLAHTQSIYDKIKSQFDSLPKDDGTLLKKREDLQKEVEQAKRALAQQNSLTAVERVKLEASAAEEQNLLYEQSDLRIEVVELTRLAAIKADEREQKARDFMRAEMRYHRAVEDLKTKQLQIQDHMKKHQEMQLKLKEFAKLYDVIKNERNKCVNLIRTSTQKSAEMKEKIKILQNEIEILRTAVMQKERHLQKQKLKLINSVVIRDSLRNEVAKQQRVDEEMREKREQQKIDIAKLNLMINQAEEQMVHLRKRYEKAVQSRNDRGIKLIERNEEVCIFYEKVNIQDQMIRKGDVELKSREEEIRFIEMQLREEKRSRELLRKLLPDKRSLEQELVTLQIQLQQCQDRMSELERMVENPRDKNRINFLDAKNPPPTEIQAKCEELELRLTEKEEALLEKDLIFEQVSRLAERIQFKTESGKEDTLQLAKKVNGVQARIKKTTRKMMALVAELSMTQAQAMHLQQELREKEADLEQCYMRMEKGEPPSEDIEQEWLRSMRAETRRLQDLQEQKQEEEEEEQYKLAGGVYTTAEPRPNAYIPDDDIELPIPRPYGSHAPFKPIEPGSTMRHIRKPKPKPIEI